MNSTHSADRPHVVIIGGGFAGLEACKRLAKSDCDVTLFDRTNHHLFQPLLYQVATAGLGMEDVASPLRVLLRKHSHMRVRQEEVVAVDVEKREVHTAAHRVSYDYLVIASGTRPSYYGHSHWADHTLPLKTLKDAMAIRERFLGSLEMAELATDPATRRRLSTVVVVGGGPTGVEMAGALAELRSSALTGDFRSFDPAETKIVLVEAAERLLPTYHPAQSAYVERRLEAMGVEVYTQSAVQDAGEGYLVAGNGHFEAATIVWAAGMEALPLTRTLNTRVDRGGRVMVDPDLSLPNRPEVFAIGDTVRLIDAAGRLVPGVAPAAIQMGKHVGKILAEEIRSDQNAGHEARDRNAFVYFDKGDMATVGRSIAVANFRGFRLQGWIAWMLWLGVHLMFLVGLKNRVSVFIGWIYAYAAYRNSARITVREATGVGEDGTVASAGEAKLSVSPV